MDDDARLPGASFVEQLCYLTLVTSLPEDDLTKFDRAGMAASLEVGAPFLDHRVVEFAWRVPLHCKVRDGTLKWLLHEALARHLPRELMERPEMGFSPPVGRWLRGPLRDWAEDLLHPGRLADEGYLQPEPIRRVWERHVTGAIDASHQLWAVLAFQAWLAEYPSPARTLSSTV